MQFWNGLETDNNLAFLELSFNIHAPEPADDPPEDTTTDDETTDDDPPDDTTDDDTTEIVVIKEETVDDNVEDEVETFVFVPPVKETIEEEDTI